VHPFFRFVNLLCGGVTSGILCALALELPNKLKLPAATWLAVQHTLYDAVGAIVEPVALAAVVSAVALLFTAERRARTLVPTVLAALLMVAGMCVWFGFVHPVSAEANRLAVSALPRGWRQVRAQWEFGHIITAALFVAGLSANIIASLVERLPRQRIMVSTSWPFQPVPPERSS
jgi:hypothetical protein